MTKNTITNAEAHGGEVQAWILGKLDERRNELGIKIEEWSEKSGIEINTLRGYLYGRSIGFPSLYKLMEPLNMTIQFPEWTLIEGTTTTELPEFSPEGMAFVDKVAANFLK